MNRRFACNMIHRNLPALLCSLLLALPSAADNVWQAPVRRSSDDRDADLVAQLIQSGNTDQAIEYCRSQAEQADPQSDDAALWTIRLSAALSAAQMAKTGFTDASITAAQAPLTQLLEAYPNHRRRLFLEAQREAVRRDAARHGVVTFSVSPVTQQRVDAATKRLSRTADSLLLLAKRVSDARAKLDSQRETRQFAMISDLNRLGQELLIDAVSLTLMQTELFDRGSQDRLGAATSAETAARQAATRLPADSPARREVERLRVEAIIRGQQYDRAESELRDLVRSLPKPISARVLAMQVRIDLARDRLDSAQARLQSFYGDSPQDAPRSIEMDLARMEWLLAQGGRGGEVGAWLDSIEQRGGLYARRRAETLSLAKLRAAGVSQTVDPSLVAAQGEDWLRRGDHGRAGDLFSAAAVAERDSDRAIRHATRAAAAWIKVRRESDAAQILSKVAMAHRTAAAAPAAHLQAAVTYHSSGLPDVAEKIEAILRENLRVWPTSPHASSARDWLVKILSSQQRHADAALAATMIPQEQVSASNLNAAIDLWRLAIRQSDSATEESIMQQFQQAFQPLLSHPQAAAKYRSAAAYLLDRDLLQGLPDRSDVEVSQADKFCDQLLDYRIGRAAGSLSTAPPKSLFDIIRWRLMGDGRDYPQMRRPIANLLQVWTAEDEDSLERAERLIWLGQVPQAEKVLRSLIEDSSDTIDQAASLLAASDHRAAKSAAIQLWDELAAGVAKGTPKWHRAKLQAIDLLHQTGNHQEAQRRAKYVLLTSPPTEPDLQKQYQAASIKK